MPANHTEVEKRLWEAADELRANSKLKSSEYSVPVLGLIFLRYADQKFTEAEKKLTAAGSGRRKIGKTDYQAQGVLFIPEKARFATLLNLPEGVDIGKAINEAMKAIEAENEDLKDVLPKTYNALEKGLLVSLLKNFSAIPLTEGDAFGKIYEYFLGKFAMAEGQKGGEFFTPISIVKLIVEIIEPYYGRILDPACGSGGMFVQSAAFVEHHKKNVNELSIYGQEKVAETIRICKMNLAVHGLSGDIRQSNTYYEDPHKSVGKFDFVMANPPFNVDKVDKERIKNDPRYPFELPKADNANYLWIQIFYSTLSATGRAGFVMANSAGDARGSELEIRKKLLQSHAVDVVVSIGPNFFYTVALPCTLWFLDRGKARTKRNDKVLFIDARNIFRQIDRAHRDFTPEHIEFISNIVRLYRGEEPETEAGSRGLMKEKFPKGKYADVLGLCKVATLDEIKAQGWSLNPGRYVGVSERAADDFEFSTRRVRTMREQFSRREIIQMSAKLGLVAATVPASVLSARGIPVRAPGQVSASPAAPVPDLHPPASGNIPVAFVISDGAVMIDFAGPWEVFQDVANPRTKLAAFHLYTVAETTAPIQASGGMRIVPNFSLANAPAPKVIVIPAQNGESATLLNWIAQSTKHSDVTMSVCTGAFLLAKTGLLDGRAATTHHGEYKTLAAD